MNHSKYAPKMKPATTTLALILALVYTTSSASAELTNHAAAGTYFDAFDSADEINQWNIDNSGAYSADINNSGTSTNQSFSASATVDGSNSSGVIKASTSIQDFEANDGGELLGEGRAVWQDTIFVDDGVVGSGDQISIRLGLDGVITADADNSQTANALVYVGVGEPGFHIVQSGLPAPSVMVDAWAQDIWPLLRIKINGMAICSLLA